jgi:tetratricopeptide (TPR) repeat protein
MFLHLCRAAGGKADLDGALQDMAHLRHIEPDYPEAAQHLQWLNEFRAAAHKESQGEDHIDWFDKGKSFQKQGEWEKAAHAFETATKIKPDFGDAYARWAGMLSEMRDFSMAIEKCQIALTYKPDDPDLYFNLASYYTQEDDDNEADENAVIAYRKCIELAPKDIEACIFLNNCLGRLDRQREAIAVLRQAHQIAPSNTQVLYILATKLMGEELPNEALEYNRKLVKLEPDNAKYQHALGVTCTATCDPDELDSTAPLQPETIGLLKEAESAFKIAFEIEPDNADSSMMQSRIARRLMEDAAHRQLGEKSSGQQNMMAAPRSAEPTREVQATEAQRRITAGLCLNCGKPLGFLDKMTGKQSHGRC